jgi:hypothetical protein
MRRILSRIFSIFSLSEISSAAEGYVDKFLQQANKIIVVEFI